MAGAFYVNLFEEVTMSMRILIVEDEEIERVSLQDDLRDAGHETLAVESPIPALELLKAEPFELVITDLKMPQMDGLQFLQEIKSRYDKMDVIVMTAYGTVKTAVKAMKLGAYDYLTKPFEIDELLQVLKRLEKLRKLVAENLQLRQQLQERHSFGKIIGKSAAMQQVYQQLEIVAKSDATVLITGETGTGKEMAANAIHYNSARAEGPFIKVSCAILSREILESELFGHVRGAFTGAMQDKKGRFELADGGTIFLDDVEDIPLELQVKLLRVLQEKEFERVGSAQPIKTDVRVIASAKKDLYQLGKEGKFREDLFYRLNVFPMRLPALRERREDVPLLFRHFLQEFRPQKPPEVDGKAMSILLEHAWEGNVRELRNLAERLALACQCDPIVAECLPLELFSGKERFYFTPANLAKNFSLEEAVAQFEQGLIEEALRKSAGNKAQAAELLGVPVSTLKSKLKKSQSHRL
jgi:DNA-binding NtrC family response regulator